MLKYSRTEIDFFKSAITTDSEVSPNSKIIDWIRARNNDVNIYIEQIPLTKLSKWELEENTGNIIHESRKFFSIEGIRVHTNWGNVSFWEQPIINQPEIGYLGIITKKINGVLHFLMQAKIEPGNINVVQISPTLQATKSNYTQVHKGKKPLFLEYFNGDKKVIVLLDQLQSEQGARFLKKRNRNIIVEIDKEELNEIPDNFKWITLGQLKFLLRHDNLVNMDSRTVISGIPFGSYGTETLKYFSALNSRSSFEESMLISVLNDEIHLHDFNHIISWITRLKSSYELSVEQIPLNKIINWVNDGMVIHHENNKYFSVIGVNVEIDNREVVSWSQPMVKPAQEGIIAFITKSINGVYHFLVQAKLEAGNFDLIELAPTVQCLTGNYRQGLNEYSVPFINDVLDHTKNKVLYSAMQSEEGGRFYKEQNLNLIIEVGDNFPLNVPNNYCWMTFNQMSKLILFNNYLNIAARSLLSAISFA